MHTSGTLYPYFWNMKTKSTSFYLFAFSFVVLLALQFYYIRNSYRLHEKELLRQAQDIASDVVNEMNQHLRVSEEEMARSIQVDDLLTNLKKYQPLLDKKQQEENTHLVDSILFAKTKSTPFKIDIISEIHSIVDEKTNEEYLKDGATLVFFKSSNSINDGRVFTEGKWTNNNFIDTDSSDARQGSSIALYSRNIFKLHNLERLVLLKVLPLTLISLCILTVLLLFFRGVQRNIQIQQQQIKQLHSTIDSITHEMNTPIATMKFQLASSPKSDETEFMQRQVGKLEKIVQSIHQSTEKSNLLTKEGAEIILKELQRNYSSTVFNINFIWEENKVLFANDAQALLQNLVDNAVKYGESKVEIALLFSSTIEINVSDDGEGIAIHDHELIFEKYYRITQPNQRNQYGLGVGLYLVAEIVSKYKGTIRIKENTPKGSTFIISIPNEK